jgi:hypothetical protein
VLLFGCAGLTPPTPAAGQAGTAGAGTCRTGPASYRIVTTSSAVTSTIDGRCTFDPASVETTCTNLYSDTTGRRFTSVSVTRHRSRGDVVDEVAVVPPLTLALGTTTTVSGAGPGTTSASTLTYDSRKRLVRTAAVTQPGSQTSTTAYTAWDTAGRPIAATITGAAGPIVTQTFSYDDATRTQSMTTAGVTCTQTFDEHGNPALGRCAGSTATTTVLTTQQVCR